MSNLSTGQIVGGVVGGVIGFFTGGPAGAFKGAALGLSIGGYVDPPPGPDLRGPTLDDKSFQSASYGVTLPRLYGRIAVYGDVIYLENNEYKSVSKSQKVGGKGGGGQKVTTTTYYATFAIALGQTYAGARPYRVWAGGKLIIGGELTGYKKVGKKLVKTFDYRFYDGTQTEPDPRMQAVLGINNTPSYEGTCYIMFYDFDLTNYGNSLSGCPIKVEFFEPDPVQEEIEQSLTSYTLNKVEQVVFPFPVDSINKVGCSSAMTAGGSYRAFAIGLSAYPTPATHLNIFAKTGPIGIIRSFDPDIYNGLAIWTHSNIGTAKITWAFRMASYDPAAMPPYAFFVETNAGRFPSPFVYENFYIVADAMAIFSTETANYVLYRVNAAVTYVPSFPLPQGTYFFAYLGVRPDQIFGVLPFGDEYQYRVLAVYLNRFYVAKYEDDTIGNKTDVTLDVYNVLSGALISSTLITLPPVLLTGYFDFFIKSAEVYEDKIYIPGYMAVGIGFFVMSIDLTTHAVDVGSFGDLDLTPPYSVEYDSTQISVYNGVIGFFLNRWDGSSYKSAIYTFAPPVINYEEPQDWRTPITQIVNREFRAIGLTDADYDLAEIADDTTVGYKVSEVSAARAAIGPIQSAYLFDMVERGYKLAAVKRGNAPVATIRFKNLVFTGDAVVKSESDSAVLMPSMLTLNYIDYDREYDTGSQNAEYPGVFNSVQSKDLAVVMQADEAAKLADIFIRTMRIEQKKYSFSLPHTYFELRVTNIIVVEVYPDKYVRMRIDQRTQDISGLITLACTATDETSYISDAAGYPGETGSDIFLPTYNDPIALVLDIPMINVVQDAFGVTATMIQPPPEVEAALLLSANEGATFSEIGRLDGAGTVAQSMTNALGPGDPFVTEYDTELLLDNVMCGEFFSVTYEQMLRNNNTVAYGQPGRWEILTYQDATPTGVGSNVILSTFIRGKYGTEQYMDDHVVGDLVVLLDDPDTIFAPMPAQSVGLSWPIKAVNVGDDADGGILAEYGTYDAVNLKQLSVVNPDLWRGGLDWIIDFDPRTRYASNQWVTGNQEQTDTIRYEIDVLNGPSVVRTIQSTTIPITYTEAQQIADFGAAQTTITIDIYQVSQRVGRGYPLRVTA